MWNMILQHSWKKNSIKFLLGTIEWQKVMESFWQGFKETVDGTADLRIGEVIEIIEKELYTLLFPAREDGKDAQLCPACNKGELHLRLGKFGSFVGCNNYPDCSFTRKFGKSEDGEEQAIQEAVPRQYRTGQSP